MTANAQCSGRCPGVCIVRIRTSPSSISVPSASGSCANCCAGSLVHVDGNAVLERQAPVPGDVVGVRVRLDDARQPDAAPLRFFEVLLDPVRGVDDDRDAGVLVSDEV